MVRYLCAVQSLLKASFCRALIMSRYAIPSLNKEQCKAHLQRNSQGTRTPQKKTPVKAQTPADSMGSCVSKNDPTASSSRLKTTGSSQGSASSKSERNDYASVTKRFSSVNRERRQDPPESCSSLSSERSTKGSGYDNHRVLAHHTRHISTDGLGYTEISRTVTGSKDSLHGHPGVHPGVGATLLRDANSSNDRSNDGSRSRATDRSGASRLRSASQRQQPEQRQHNPANYANLSPVKNTRMSDDEYNRIITSQIFASSSTLGYGSPENRKFGGTVSGSSVSNYEAGVDATLSQGANSKAKIGQSGLWSPRASPGSLDAELPLIHTSATTSSGPPDANGRSNGRQSRTRGRTGATGLRSASQGLRNLGNTCYMNSILQCLAKVPWFEDRPHLKFRDDLLNEFFGLMRKMQENVSDSSLDPCQFRKQISALGFRFSSSEQNDAHEFLLCLLSRLSKTLKSEGKPDLITEFLLGRQQNVIRFTECEHVLVNEQPFFSLSLPLTSEGGKSVDKSIIVALQHCLENYTKKEEVDGDALCMDCQAKQRKAMQPCSIEASLKCLPGFLMIHLKRYDFMRAVKQENEVFFPQEKLEIKRKDVNSSGDVLGREEVVVYDLIAVCNHYGSLRFGHYTADIKSPSNNWYNYSDSRVTPTDPNYWNLRDVYILFYQRCY